MPIVFSEVFQQIDPEDIFERQGRIGRGSFGEVYKGIRKQNGEVRENFVIMDFILKVVAIKIIDLESAEDDIDDIQQEIHVSCFNLFNSVF